jgi:hypothetical protein
MKPGTLVRLVRNKSLHNTIEVRSGSQGEDMANFRMVPMFTILPDMIGICVVEGDLGLLLQVLFGDKLVWVDIEVVEPLEDNG